MIEQKDETLSRKMTLILDAGQKLLANGGEVFRAQQTMEIMARSLAVPQFRVYVLTNGIFASAGGEAGNQVRHIPVISTNLGRVEAVNELSRELADGALTLEQAEARLAEVESLRRYSAWVCVLCGAVGSACFAWLFGGRLAEMQIAFVAGGLEVLVGDLLKKHHINKIFSDICCAAMTTMLALLCHWAFPAVNVNTAIIGALMVLTPGVALVMAVRDLISADYLSGTIRVINALLIAGCLAGGVGLSYTAARYLGVL